MRNKNTLPSLVYAVVATASGLGLFNYAPVQYRSAIICVEAVFAALAILAILRNGSRKKE